MCVGTDTQSWSCSNGSLSQSQTALSMHPTALCLGDGDDGDWLFPLPALKGV